MRRRPIPSLGVTLSGRPHSLWFAPDGCWRLYRNHLREIEEARNRVEQPCWIDQNRDPFLSCRIVPNRHLRRAGFHDVLGLGAIIDLPLIRGAFRP
jgi:hypothetical protein